MKIAISLISLKPKMTGGIDSSARNMLDGFATVPNNNDYILLCSEDNIESFRHYASYPRFSLFECPVRSNDMKATVFYELFKLDRDVSKVGADFCFIPNSRMPYLGHRNKYIVVIDDLRIFYFPEHESKWKALYRKWNYKLTARSADKIVTISNAVKNDIVRFLKCPSDKVQPIYIPIPSNVEFSAFDTLAGHYKIEKGRYFYCIAPCLPHKNLLTILKVINEIKKSGNNSLPQKLIISGATYDTEYSHAVESYIKENELQNDCLFTGYISNEDRNALIKNSAQFLFPSVFEGFGMPVIEALQIGVPVVTTKCASIPEVSQGKAIYVSDPYNVDEWILKIKEGMNVQCEPFTFPEYTNENCIKQYLDLFDSFEKSF